MWDLDSHKIIGHHTLSLVDGILWDRMGSYGILVPTRQISLLGIAHCLWLLDPNGIRWDLGSHSQDLSVHLLL